MTLLDALQMGITPAHAGKRFGPQTSSCQYRDHPRTCGEKPTSHSRILRLMGSPPHMRGKGGRHPGVLRLGGITPAHAGKRTGERIQVSISRDHPRTCGEKLFVPIVSPSPVGSPPHMRGKVRMKLFPWEKFGITPAHAGKRQLLPPLIRLRRDHPRTCGEKNIWISLCSSFSGSPPHMRGKDHRHLLHAGQAGITPAHAGKSSDNAHALGADGDHPRTCGEKITTDSRQIL